MRKWYSWFHSATDYSSSGTHPTYVTTDPNKIASRHALNNNNATLAPRWRKPFFTLQPSPTQDETRGPLLTTFFVIVIQRSLSGTGLESLLFWGRIMAHAPSTAWMSTAFRSTSETLRYQNRWLSDSKWHELVKEHYFADGKQDQAEELKFSTTSLVRAINRQWKESLDDFTTTSNTTGIFRHAAKPRNSSGTRRKVTYFYVTTQGQRPKKPQVAQIFEEEDLQDEFVRKARKRKQPSDDEVDKTGQDQAGLQQQDGRKPRKS